MANRYVSSALWSAVTAWAAGAVVTLGTIRRQLATPTQGNERCWRCTTAGTTGGAEPSWTLTANSTTNDNGVVWTECTGQETYNPAGNWTAPHATFDHAHSFASSGDTLFVDKNHAETWNAVTKTYTKNLIVQVVTVAGSTQPPGAEHAATGAVLTYTGNGGYPNFTGTWDISGVSFQIGSGSNAVYFAVGSSSGAGIVNLRDCAIALNTTNGASYIYLGQGTVNRGVLAMTNCPLTFGAAGQGVWFSNMNGSFYWADTPNGINGTSPTALLLDANEDVHAEIIGVDLSGLTGKIAEVGSGSNGFGGRIVVAGCKLNSGVTLASSMRTFNRHTHLSFVSVDDTTGNKTVRMAYGTPCSNEGWLSTTSHYRTGGAQLDSVPYGIYCLADHTTTGAPTYMTHPVGPPMPVFIETAGVAKTLTVHALADKGALPTSNMLWLEAHYFGSSASPVMSVAQGGPSVAVGANSPTNLTATTENWNAGVSARANSTAYTRGQTIKTASNSNRVFFCTTAGTSAGSEPGGYASAVDGGSVTDGTAVFRAGYRVSMTLSVTPQRVGWMTVQVHYVDRQASGANTRIYIDPLVIVT